MELTGKLIQLVAEAQQDKISRTEIYNDESASGEHEFLFFIKPEITLKESQIQLESILEMIFEKLAEFSMNISKVLLLPAKYLEKHNIIAQHYGVINAIAGNANNLNSNAKLKFEELFRVPFNSANVLGGIEFQKEYPELTATSVDYIWQNSPTQKLGGGAYAQELKIDGEAVYLVNGFHPRQLEHFIAPGRSIIAMTLRSNTSWSDARNKMIGKTNPADAAPGSIRRTLLEHKEDFGLKAVSPSWNGVHLSAGPVEGLVELIRYNSDQDNNKQLTATSFDFGKKLLDNFDDRHIAAFLKNDEVVYEGKTVSSFDLTEECNADEAIEKLRKVKI